MREWEANVKGFGVPESVVHYLIWNGSQQWLVGDQHDNTNPDTNARPTLYCVSDLPLQEVHTLAIETQLGIGDNFGRVHCWPH